MRTKAGMILSIFVYKRAHDAWCACTAAAAAVADIFIQMANIARVIIEFGRNFFCLARPLPTAIPARTVQFFFCMTHIYHLIQTTATIALAIATTNLKKKSSLNKNNSNTKDSLNKQHDLIENILCVCVHLILVYLDFICILYESFLMFCNQYRRIFSLQSKRKNEKCKKSNRILK